MYEYLNWTICLSSNRIKLSYLGFDQVPSFEVYDYEWEPRYE